MTNDIVHLYRYLFAIHKSTFMKKISKYFTHFLLGYFLLLNLRVLYILWVQVFHWYEICKYFVPVYGSPFHSLAISDFIFCGPYGNFYF